MFLNWSNLHSAHIFYILKSTKFICIVVYSTKKMLTNKTSKSWKSNLPSFLKLWHIFINPKLEIVLKMLLSMKFPFYENSYLSMKLPVINIFWLWNLLSMQCPIFEMFCPWNVFLYNVLTPNCLGWRVGSKPDRSKPSCNLRSWLEPQYRYTGTAGEHFILYFFRNII